MSVTKEKRLINRPDIPCKAESDKSIRCLEDNAYNYSKCEEAFSNYRICKKFWGAVSNERKKKQIKPEMPPLEERERIKKHYLKTGKIPEFAA